VGSLTTEDIQRRWKLTLCLAGHVGRLGS
jgi:hypothetical protein